MNKLDLLILREALEILDGHKGEHVENARALLTNIMIAGEQNNGKDNTAEIPGGEAKAAYM